MGYAQSNERVSAYLKNLGIRSQWLNKPDLIVINSTGIGQGKDAKKVFDFTINVGIKRPRDQETMGSATSAAAGLAPAANSQVVTPSVKAAL